MEMRLFFVFIYMEVNTILTLENQWKLVMKELGHLNPSEHFNLQIAVKGEIGEELFAKDWLSKFLNPAI